MTRDKARELPRKQAQVADGHTRNARLILAEAPKEHGRQAVGCLIRELDPERIFGFALGTHFKGA